MASSKVQNWAHSGMRRHKRRVITSQERMASYHLFLGAFRSSDSNRAIPSSEQTLPIQFADGGWGLINRVKEENRPFSVYPPFPVSAFPRGRSLADYQGERRAPRGSKPSAYTLDPFPLCAIPSDLACTTEVSIINDCSFFEPS